MSWLDEQASGATPLLRTVGLRPELAPLLDEFLAATRAATADPLTLELCRLRIAQIHGDRGQLALRQEPALAAGLTEEHVAALDDYLTSPVFTAHQRHCLAYAEQYVIDVHGITDADAAAVKQEMSDDQYVAFTVALGLFDGLGRMRLALGVDERGNGSVPVSPAH